MVGVFVGVDVIGRKGVEVGCFLVGKGVDEGAFLDSSWDTSCVEQLSRM